MFKEHDFVLWGTCCSCGCECGILQNQHHPWIHTAFVVKLICPLCGKEVSIDKNRAEAFYNKKIFSYFRDLYGTVVDFGCGGGFLSRYLIQQSKVDRVIGLDTDNCFDLLSDLNKQSKFTFIKYDGSDLSKVFKGVTVNFLVSRDVFMFLEDTQGYFNDVSHFVKKGIRQMGWYKNNSSKMKNQLEPEQIAEEYKKRGWAVREEDLNWYMSGYFISADKISI